MSIRCSARDIRRNEAPGLAVDWMNQVEPWFSIVQRKRLRILDCSDLDQLADHLMSFVAAWNTDAHPFNWSTKSEALVMAKCERHTSQAVAA
jgi:hypothetical protein